MRKVLGAVVVATLVTAVGAAPVAAQQDLLDLPRLGFTIDPTEGLPGTVVNGHVDVNDVNANCFTTAQQIGQDLSQGIPVLIQQYVSAEHGGVQPDPTTPEGGALTIFQLLSVAFGANLEGAADQVFDQSFVMTFANPSTQELVGDLGHFDPTTGEGSVVVPGVVPGIWAVAAACVEIKDADNVGEGAALAGFSEAVALLESAIVQANLPLPVVLDATTTEFIANIAPELLPSILTQRALGFQLFCVLSPDGTCAASSSSAADDPSAAGANPATSVGATPRFTG